MAVDSALASNIWANLRGVIRGWRHEAVRTSIFIVTALILAFFILYPLGILFQWSLTDESTGTWTLNNYREFFSDPELYSALLTTLKLSVGTSICSLIIALPMAWGASRTDMPLRGLVRSMVVLTFATPSFLIAVGWITLLGPRATKLWLEFVLSQEAQQIFAKFGYNTIRPDVPHIYKRPSMETLQLARPDWINMSKNRKKTTRKFNRIMKIKRGKKK
jgi:ABC-type spermidine/putrescine transport system permease subunit I